MRLSAPGNYIIRHVSGRHYLVNVAQRGSYIPPVVLNGTGVDILAPMLEGADDRKAAAALARKYDIDDETARADVEEFLAIIQKAGGLELVP